MLPKREPKPQTSADPATTQAAPAGEPAEPEAEEADVSSVGTIRALAGPWPPGPASK